MKKSLAIFLLIVSAIFVVIDCNESSASSTGDTIVQIGLDGTTKPFNYTTDNGDLIGYEIDMLKELDRRLDGITFKYNITPWDSLFASLDAGRYQMICNNITWKKEREEKYLFSSEYYFKNHTVLITAKGSTDIKSIADLQGKPIEVEAGTATAIFLEKYNELHTDNPIKLIYSQAKIAAVLSNVFTGRYPAAIYTSTYVDTVEKDLGIELGRHQIPNEDDIQKSEAYLLFGKSQKDIANKINAALKAMKADGTLSKICINNFGADYTK